MKNHNWKLLGLMMALVVLCACLLGGAALADPDPEHDLEVVEIVGGEFVDDVYSGSTYYKMFVDYPESESQELFQITWTGKPEGGDFVTEPGENWYGVTSEWLHWEGERAFLYIAGGDGQGETLFLRHCAEDEPQAFYFSYSQLETDKSVEITNEQGPLLLEPFTLQWSEVADADSYIFHWIMPNGTLIEERTEDNYVELNDESHWYGGDCRTTSVPGDYEAYVEAWVDGAIIESERVNWTVGMPENTTDHEIRFNSQIEPDEEDEKRHIRLYENFEFEVYAPGAFENRVEVFFGDGDKREVYVDGNADPENDEYGYHWEDYEYYHEEHMDIEGPRCYTAYARAKFEEDGEWVYSESTEIWVSLDGPEITGTLPCDVLNEDDTVARDELVQVEVDVSNIPESVKLSSIIISSPLCHSHAC